MRGAERLVKRMSFEDFCAPLHWPLTSRLNRMVRGGRPSQLDRNGQCCGVEEKDMGVVVEADFRKGVVLTEENLDDFDFELSCALDALPRCLTERDEELLQAHFETLLKRAESGMRGAK